MSEDFILYRFIHQGERPVACGVVRDGAGWKGPISVSCGVEASQPFGAELLRLAAQVRELEQRDKGWSESVNSWMEILGLEPGQTEEDFDDALKAIRGRVRELEGVVRTTGEALAVLETRVADLEAEEERLKAANAELEAALRTAYDSEREHRKVASERGLRIAGLEAENAVLRERLNRAEHDFTYMQRRLDGEDEPEQEFPLPGCNCTNCREER